MNIHRLSAADYSEYPRERGEWPQLKYDVMRRAGTKERTTGRTRRFLVRFNVCVLFLHLSATICFSWKKSKVKNQFVHIPIFLLWFLLDLVVMLIRRIRLATCIPFNVCSRETDSNILSVSHRQIHQTLKQPSDVFFNTFSL